VVDIDRVTIRYANLDDLARDLRAMGASSVLAERPPNFKKSEVLHLRQAFLEAGEAGRTEEIVEILHFLGWRK